MNESIVQVPAYTGVDRRRHKRIRGPFTSRCRVRSGGSERSDWDMIILLNLSAGGAAFRHDSGFGVGELLDLHINFPPARTMVQCFGEVVRTAVLGQGLTHEVGVRFISIEDQHREMIDKAASDFYLRKGRL